MSATTTQTIHLLDCPVCGKPIELHATYEVRRDEASTIRTTAKVVTATLTMTGAHVNHTCPPPKLLRGKGFASPALVIPSIRED